MKTFEIVSNILYCVVSLSSAAMPPGMVRRLSALAVRTLLPLLLLLAVGRPFTSSPSGVVHGSDSSPSGLYPTFIRNDTLFEHIGAAPRPPAWVGSTVGARDHLFQLDRFLRLELQNDTGPVVDSRECLPPVTESNCPQARPTSNHNKLLLVDPYSMELITCGSVNQGICQKRSLDSVNEVRFSTERPVDTQYVAANHPNVSTVGLVVRSHPDRQPVLFVGSRLHQQPSSYFNTKPRPGSRVFLRGDRQVGRGWPSSRNTTIIS